MARMTRAPEALKGAVMTLLLERDEKEYEPHPHELVRRALHKSSTAEWPNDRVYELKQWLDGATLEDFSRILQAMQLDEDEEERVNEALGRSDKDLTVLNGRLQKSGSVSQVLQLTGLAEEAAQLLNGKFGPPLKQYQRALEALEAYPVNQEKAVSEAVGALEAVLQLMAGKGYRGFTKDVDDILRGERPWTRLLGKSLGQLQGYRSQLPGAGHGRYAESEVTDAEARFVVRTCGAAIAYLIEDHQRGRW